MTTFNRCHLIIDSIKSIQNQTYSNWELIILDDFSTDDTIRIISDYIINDPRIFLFQNEFNLGQFANRNKIADLASSDTLIYLDSDDLFASDALQYIKNCLLRYPNIDFATICIDDKMASPTVLQSEQIINHHLFSKSILHIGPSGTVITKKLFQKIHGFPLSYGPAGDMFYNIKAASNSTVLCMPYNYLNYRRHEGQQINDPFAYLHNGYRYFNDILDLDEIPLIESQKSYLKLKNKRRFFVNSLKYLFKYKNVKKFRSAYSFAAFTIKDIFKAIFQW